MKSRPRLKIELTQWDKNLELIGWFTLVILWTLSIIAYNNLPSKIPIHFNVLGLIDNYGNKSKILVLPTVGSLLFIGMTIINRFPHLFNYPAKITAENALRQYTLASKMLRYLKFIIAFIFSIIVLITWQAATGKSAGLGIWLLPLTIGLLIIPIIYFIIKSMKLK